MTKIIIYLYLYKNTSTALPEKMTINLINLSPHEESSSSPEDLLQEFELQIMNQDVVQI